MDCLYKVGKTHTNADIDRYLSKSSIDRDRLHFPGKMVAMALDCSVIWYEQGRLQTAAGAYTSQSISQSIIESDQWMISIDFPHFGRDKSRPTLAIFSQFCQWHRHESVDGVFHRFPVKLSSEPNSGRRKKGSKNLREF